MRTLTPFFTLTTLSAALLLSACASWEPPAEAQHDPEHKQLITGSRIAYKGRGGPDAVKTASRESMKEQMRSVVESRPLSN